MKTTKSRIGKIKMALLAAAAMVSVPVVGMAASTTVSATAKLLGALTLTPTNMNFGNITFTGVLGAGDTYTLKTDGSVVAAGGKFADGGGTKTVGNIDVTGSAANNISIKCDASTTLVNGTHTILLNNIKVEAGAGTGAGTACAGLAGAAAVAAFPLTAGPDSFKVGATIDGATITGGAIVAGTYTTTTPINFTVLYD